MSLPVILAVSLRFLVSPPDQAATAILNLIIARLQATYPQQ